MRASACVCPRQFVLGGNFNQNINRMFVWGAEETMTLRWNQAIFSSREMQERTLDTGGAVPDCICIYICAQADRGEMARTSSFLRSLWTTKKKKEN